MHDRLPSVTPDALLAPQCQKHMCQDKLCGGWPDQQLVSTLHSAHALCGFCDFIQSDSLIITSEVIVLCKEEHAMAFLQMSKTKGKLMHRQDCVVLKSRKHNDWAG